MPKCYRALNSMPAVAFMPSKRRRKRLRAFYIHPSWKGSQGIRAIVSHSVTRLVNECAKFDASFADFQVGFLDRIKLLLDLNRFGLLIEPVGYTVAEFRKMKQAGNPFIAEVVDKGKVLYQG